MLEYASFGIAFISLLLAIVAFMIDGEGISKSIKTKIGGGFLITTLIFGLLGTFFNSSEPTSTGNESTPPASIPIVINTDTNPLVKSIDSELITQNNCDGIVPITTTIGRTREVAHTLNMGTQIAVNTDGNVEWFGINIGIGGAVAQHFNVVYGTIESITKSVSVEVPPNTNMEYTIHLAETWETGDVSITVDGKNTTLPFEFRKGFSIYINEVRNLSCSPTPPPATSISTSQTITIMSTDNDGEIWFVPEDGIYTIEYVDGAHSLYSEDKEAECLGTWGGCWLVHIKGYLNKQIDWQPIDGHPQTPDGDIEIGNTNPSLTREDAITYYHSLNQQLNPIPLKNGDYIIFIIPDVRTVYDDNRGEVTLRITKIN